MLQKEFEERIGRKVTDAEYVEANAVYMAAGDSMDKDLFCREWEVVGGSPLVKGLYETAYKLNNALTEERLQLKEMKELVSEAGDAMLEIADGLLGGETDERKASDAAGLTIREVLAAGMLRHKAGWLVGEEEVTRRRVEKGYRLDNKDRETIIAALGLRPVAKEDNNNINQ